MILVIGIAGMIKRRGSGEFYPRTRRRMKSPSLVESTRTLFWRRKSGPRRQVQEPGRAVRRGPWKLIELADGKRFLFDLRKDIGETNNLVDQHPDLATELSKALTAWETAVAQ